MKRILSLAMCILMVILSGCAQISCTYPMMHDHSDIQSIEIYQLDEPGEGGLPPEAQPICSLDSSNFEAIYQDILSIPFYRLVIFLPVPIDPGWTMHGYVVKITYQNEDYELIGNRGYQVQSSNDASKNRGLHLDLEDGSLWDSMIQKYLETN